MASASAAHLLDWYDAHKRDLPWRRSRDPYAIWISEVMLQQTRVETVLPYYARFLERFPDFETLARAPIDDVLTAWSGLGYYRRARGLHACAKEVVVRYGGRLPASESELRTLPGVGEYTAGAVSSIAFGARSCAIDGNVTRVIARYLALEGHADTPSGKRAIRAAVEALMDPRRPGDFNQALMELGATTCTPKAPKCGTCPLEPTCAARQRGVENDIAVSKKGKPSPRVALVAARVERDGAVLLGRRPLDGLFGGLWEPPSVEGSIRSARVAFSRAGIELGRTTKLPSIVHVLTHRVLEVRVAPARAGKLGLLPPYTALAFVPRTELEATAMSTLARRLLGVSFADA